MSTKGFKQSMFSNNHRLKLDTNINKLFGKSPKYLKINTILMDHEGQKGDNRVKYSLQQMTMKIC